MVLKRKGECIKPNPEPDWNETVPEPESGGKRSKRSYRKRELSLSTADTLVQIGIFLGAEWSNTDIARHLGVNSQTISHRRSRDHTALIESARAWTKIAISKYVEERLKKAENDLNERKRRLQSKGYRVLEKTVDHALSPEVEEPDQTHLRAAEIGIERVEGKALDRKAILERNEHIYRIEVDGDELEQVLHEVAQINELRRKSITGTVADAATGSSALDAEPVAK